MIAIFAKSYPSFFVEKMRVMFTELTNKKISLAIYQPFYELLKKDGFCIECQCFNNNSDLPKNTKLFLSIGGDGTMLEAVTIVRNSKIPLAGINTGRLGFLADIFFDEIKQTIDLLCNEKYKLQPRSILEITSENFEIGACNFAFNDFTLQKNHKAKLLRINAAVNGKYLNTYWADGIIVSTATGSTAYSLSVGGPILLPESKSLIISPIASHNLSVRPIVLEESSIIELSIDGREESYMASLDGRIIEVPPQVTFKVKLAKFQITMVQLPDYDFFSTLRNKLLWGIDKRNFAENKI